MASAGQNAISVSDFRAQAYDFLAKGRRYLADGDLHQASEKGWGAAAWMAKAAAEHQGWSYTRHDEFFTVMRQAQQLSAEPRIRDLRDNANALHGCFYQHESLLDAGDIAEGLNRVEILLEILDPLTHS